MNVLVSGGTGFVGSALVTKLVDDGNMVWITTRHPDLHTNTSNITYIKMEQIQNLLNLDVVVNLAGETINGRWTNTKKEKILNSRLETTQMLIKAIARLQYKPDVFINASAIGFYGISRDRKFTESILKPGEDFLASVVTEWEQEALKASELGIRTVITRFGMILGKNEGALPKMLLPYKLFIGGPIGSGEQWISWVHIDDVVGLIEFCIKNDTIKDVVNVTSPTPIKMKDLGESIGKVMNRPHWFPTPSLPIKLLFGEMSILVLEGQYVLPEKALKYGYNFHYNLVEKALENIIE